MNEFLLFLKVRFYWASLPEISERTTGGNFADVHVTEAIAIGAEHVELRGVRLPLWSELEIIVHSLMTEEHVLVAPVRSHHLGLGDHASDERLGATQLIRLILSIDVEESGVGRNCGQVLGKGCLVRVFREFPLSGRLEAQFPWEQGSFLGRTILSDACHIGHTNSLDILRCGLESQCKWDESF